VQQKTFAPEKMALPRFPKPIVMCVYFLQVLKVSVIFFWKQITEKKVTNSLLIWKSAST